MKLQDISDKFRAHLRAVKGRLSSSEIGDEQQRLDIDRIIRLHCEAELVKLTALVELAAAKGDSTANSQYVTVLDFDCVAKQTTLGYQQRLTSLWRLETMPAFNPKRFILWFVALLLCVVTTGMLAVAQQPASDEELQMGQEVFDQLKAKGEIIKSSPLYDQLKPIADSITQAAQPKYNHPFKFYLVHEQQPNAFATPGGNVYVVDSLLYFVKNKEQLAGTLCHEVSHTIHHDTVVLMEKQEKIEEREVAAAVLMGPTKAHILAIALVGKLHSLGYSRDVESRADLTGSDICAQAGYNPWGLVWLFQDFQNANMNQVPQLLSDHPNDRNRVTALEQHFHQNPAVFAKFNQDPKSGTPLSVPKDAAEVFIH